MLLCRKNLSLIIPGTDSGVKSGGEETQETGSRCSDGAGCPFDLVRNRKRRYLDCARLRMASWTGRAISRPTAIPKKLQIKSSMSKLLPKIS